MARCDASNYRRTYDELAIWAIAFIGQPQQHWVLLAHQTSSAKWMSRDRKKKLRSVEYIFPAHATIARGVRVIHADGRHLFPFLF